MTPGSGARFRRSLKEFFLRVSIERRKRGDSIFVAREALKWACSRAWRPSVIWTCCYVYTSVSSTGPSHATCRSIAPFARLLIRAAHHILAPFKDDRYRHYACAGTRRNRKSRVQSCKRRLTKRGDSPSVTRDAPFRYYLK